MSTAVTQIGRSLARIVIALAIAVVAYAQTSFLSVKEIRAGQRGVGRTVFSGTKVEEFQVEILGVLENIGPKQNIILGRLSGGPLERTGVMQGMSGSPVWIDGKLIGAVALAFPFAKEPIAGIRPIGEMLDTPLNPPSRVERAAVRLGEARLEEVATPVSFSGFTGRAIQHFAAEWRKMGLEPLQGVGGRAAAPAQGAGSQAGDGGVRRPSPAIEPGSMISVQLVSGDMSIGADGTVTHIDKDRLFAFGHRFLGVGSGEMPFARSEVLTLLPNLGTSFKISGAREALGTIQFDGNAAIAGRVGVDAAMVDVQIAVSGSGKPMSYRMKAIHHPMLTPFLLQMMMFSAIDGTERTLGPATIELSAEAKLDGAAPVRIRQTLANDFNAPLVAAISTASPLSALFMSSATPVRLRSINIEMKIDESRRTLQIDGVSLSRREVRPGDTVEIAVALAGDGAPDRIERVRYTVPAWMPPGPLQITAADALTSNLSDGKVLLGLTGTRPTDQVVKQLNALRDSGSVFVRVWRQEPGYTVGGADLANLPAGMSMLMARSTPAGSPALQSKLVEFERATGSAVSGQRTVQLEVKD